MASKLSEIEAEPLELSRAGREVWLAKVPHFVSEAWRSPASGAADVGRLRMVVDPTAEPGTPAAAPQVTGCFYLPYQPSSQKYAPVGIGTLVNWEVRVWVYVARQIQGGKRGAATFAHTALHFHS